MIEHSGSQEKLGRRLLDFLLCHQVISCANVIASTFAALYSAAAKGCFRTDLQAHE